MLVTIAHLPFLFLAVANSICKIFPIHSSNKIILLYLMTLEAHCNSYTNHNFVCRKETIFQQIQTKRSINPKARNKLPK